MLPVLYRKPLISWWHFSKWRTRWKHVSSVNKLDLFLNVCLRSLRIVDFQNQEICLLLRIDYFDDSFQAKDVFIHSFEFKMSCGHGAFIVLLLFCQIVGLMLFLRGFFPLKKAIHGRATNENLPPEPSVEGTRHPLPPKFERVVIMLIDALRADFVFSEQTKMPFTQEMIKRNRTFR